MTVKGAIPTEPGLFVSLSNLSKKQEEWANGPYGKNHPNKGFHHFFLLGESKKEAA